jgi:D-alanine-D-alanine ligase
MSLLPPLKVRQAAEFGRVGLVIGGDSAERQVSLNGGAAVAGALASNGIDHRVFDGPLALFEAIGEGEIDRVFNLLHGPGGEDGSLQGALQLMKVPVTGADLAASALTMDKLRSKWIWERNGIATPPATATTSGRWTVSVCPYSSSRPGWDPASASAACPNRTS